MVHLSAEAVEVDNPGGKAFKRFALAKQCLDADVIVNMPKLKTHGLCLFTGGVKNILGCVPGLGKAQLHLRARGIESFSQALVDLYGLVRPALTVMDGIVGMDGAGPRNGSPKRIGEPIEHMRVEDFELPKTAGPVSMRTKGAVSFLQGRLVAKPVVVAEKREGCWVCVEHCPTRSSSSARCSQGSSSRR